MSIINFQLVPKKLLGVDIGTSAVKVVELSGWGRKKTLENYGEIKAESLYQKSFRTFDNNGLTLSNKDIAKSINAILEEAKIKTREAVFSIPDFSSFFTWFELPPMSKEELPQAVSYEARQHIPLPLSEVTLDWQLIGRSADKNASSKILLVAVPNQIISQYQEIANLAKVKLKAMEAEVFGLIHSLFTEEDKGAAMVIDIGAQSTTVSVVDNRVLKISHSFDICGNELTAVLSKGLGIKYNEAEELKKTQGILPVSEKTRKILLPMIDLIISEIEKISQSYLQSENKEIEKVILAGGSALMPGIREYFYGKIRKPIEIANPFSDIFYPPLLENELKKIGPSYAIAVGMAVRGLE